jgi:hypothetical protein
MTGQVNLGPAGLGPGLADDLVFKNALKKGFVKRSVADCTKTTVA